MYNNTTRFSNRVDNYVKYRPSYPKDIISFLETETGLDTSFSIADIGSGTGILFQLFLNDGNTIYGVEPNHDMREKAEELLQQYDSFISINGTAEQTMLLTASVDMIIAGQAFHWFDPVKTKAEFRRIARPHAYCVLIWNERQIESPFEKAYEQLLLDFATDYLTVRHNNIGTKELADFFSPNDFITATFPNAQVFDFDGLKGRLLSSSYIPGEKHPKFEDMIASLQKIFYEHQDDNRVQFNYTTKLYTGKMNT